MKTAISIPDDLFRQVDDFAKRLGKSRSEVYRDALREYLRQRDAQSLTDAMNKVIDEVGTEVDPWVAEASRQVLLRSEW